MLSKKKLKVSGDSAANEKAYSNMIAALGGFVRPGAIEKCKAMVPSGHWRLDFAIAYGMLPDNADLDMLPDGGKYDPKIPIGLPLGRIVEIYGPEGGGKSSLAYRIVGYAQKMGLPCLWIDAEKSFKENLAELNGVDINTLVYSNLIDQVDEDKMYAAEDVLEMMTKACKSGAKVVVLDSIPPLMPESEMSKGIASEEIAKLARVLSRGIKKVQGAAHHHDTLVIMINQVREKPGVLYGCFHGDTLICFEDGDRIPIQKVVEDKIDKPVLSFNKETGAIESKRIVNWFNNGNIGDIEDDIWLSFLVEGPGSKNGRTGFTCTSNHTLFLYDGKQVSAEEVVVGDDLLSYYEQYVLNDSICRDVIIGSLLGDGKISVRSHHTACFSIANSEQPEYLKWKQNILSSYLSFKKVSSSGNFGLRERFDSEYSVELKMLKDQFYINGSGYRQIPEDLKLTPLMASVWYMDEGTLKYDDNRVPVPMISIKRLKNNLLQIERAISLIESLDSRLCGRVTYQKSNSVIQIASDVSSIFFDLIGCYVPECMQYKLPQKIYMEKPLENSKRTVKRTRHSYPAKVLDKTIGSDRKYRKRQKFDLKIEDNATYIVGGDIGVVVHNSPETTPGGRAIRHAYSLRLNVRKASGADSVIKREKSDGSTEILGRYSNVKIEKTRLAPPLIDANGSQIAIRVPIYYKPYFPSIDDQIFEIGRSMKMITVRKGVYSWEDIKVEGQQAFIDECRDKKQWSNLANALVKTSLENNVVLPPELNQVIAEDALHEKTEGKAIPKTRSSGKAKDGSSDTTDALEE